MSELKSWATGLKSCGVVKITKHAATNNLQIEFFGQDGQYFSAWDGEVLRKIEDAILQARSDIGAEWKD